MTGSTYPTQEELREMKRKQRERMAGTMPDVYVFPGVYYHTSGLGQLNERIHVDPDAPDNDPVIILDADYVKMASLDEIIDTIAHEVIHNVLEWEHGYPSSFYYHNVSDFIEFWRNPDKSDWREKLLQDKRRSICPDCKHATPYRRLPWKGRVQDRRLHRGDQRSQEEGQSNRRVHARMWQVRATRTCP